MLYIHLSLFIRNAIDNEDTMIKNRAGAAVLAKKASEEAPQIDVASVLNPIGLNIIVAGNSFITNRNTSAPPASTPVLISGK